MSKIDQAFVKAFAKERPKTPSPEAASTVVDLAALGMSSFWVDPSNNDWMRVDEPQTQPARKPTSGRRRGDRPGPPRRPSSPTAPAASAPEPSPGHSIELLRIDTRQTQPSPAPILRTRLDAGSFPAITVTHDAIEDATEVLERPYAAEPVAEVPAAPAIAIVEPEPPVAAAAAPLTIPNIPLETAPLETAPVETAPVETAPVETTVKQVTEQPETIVLPTPAEPPAVATPVTPQKPFEAAWEVDEFETPAIINELLTNGGMISGAGIPLAQAARDGMKKVLITSPQRGAGRSTLAIGLALAAATTGVRVALVDGDWNHPSLVDDLQLDLEFGWPEAIRGGVALSETAVHSVGDGVTLFPIVPTAAGLTPQTNELHQTINQLVEHFDLIIVDGPSADEPMPKNCFQSGIIVRDLRSFDKAAIDDSIQSLREAGIAQIGVAENFAN